MPLDSSRSPRQNRTAVISVHLTRRETEILTWSAKGKTTSEIATILSLSDSTVIQHVKNVCMKLDAVNKTQAVALAITQGLINP